MKPKATLVSRDGRRWPFEVTSGTCGRLTHTTRYGNRYAIMHGVVYSKPFWVGRLIGSSSWVSWEDKLGARCIEFDGGGKYFFPGWG